MAARRFAEAEQVYREDLKRLPENGWSLFGLSEALAAQGKSGAELEATRARFEKVWAKADVKSQAHVSVDGPRRKNVNRTAVSLNAC
jgi:hypothetical protein